MKFRKFALALLSLALAQAGLVSSADAAASATATTTTKASKPVAKSGKHAKTPAKTPAKKTVRQRAPRKAAAAAPRKVSFARAPVALPDPGSVSMHVDAAGRPQLRSTAFFVTNQSTGHVILEHKSETVIPIASITKLMTAMVVLDGGQPLVDELSVSEADVDTLKGSSSRLAPGVRLTRDEMLRLALMSSENRAASSLARHYPGGEPAFVEAMNAKARMIGLTDTHFSDPTGLNPANVSSPRDLARMVAAAASYPLIREATTTAERYVQIGSRMQRFGNTNSLVRSPDWEIGVSKTGYIREAGRCLVMQAWVLKQPLLIVLMDSDGRYSRTADAVRIKKWIEATGPQVVAALNSRRGD
ncbi:MAG TPA: serine hydrolase [Aromatoleum sp.]|uniref:serine hydrolase n=1 Tax=Aromatoleum sp. TaxID=2307007 RepID=UPI002B48E375|nr:serine hydrolase [Aromatoleum sp.]HJV26999.1 serine hydrolase [Aromatoleum sp.]